MIHLKRVYEPPSGDDGMRILVERLWPRGLTKEKAAIDLWMRDIAPSEELRRWYGHEPDRWPQFCKRYVRELEANREAVGRLRKEISGKTATFVFAARDTERNSAVVLKGFLNG